ncbi:MAG TPA: LPS export ABC transporter periplasmic protein LptC [Xanthobacteraceae bacterium]|nr:LPS export ABC transporter periplasmic protein LptC [Xanthobacteraceae bacterium]
MNRSVLAAEFDDAGGHGWVGTSRPGLDRAFRAAARHSRFVRFLRVAVPVLVAAAAIAVLLATWFSPARLLAKLPTGGGSLSSVGISGTKITMQLPRLEGFTRDGRPYLLTAKTAAQDLLKPDNVELSDVHAKMERSDKAVVEMSAASGLYHSKADQLILRERIVLTSTSGYEGHFSEAVVDMHSGHVVSDKPVEVKLLNGLLKANRMEVEGELLRFDGGVTLDMDGRSLSSTGERSSQ